jgi:hypothetical protein
MTPTTVADSMRRLAVLVELVPVHALPQVAVATDRLAVLVGEVVAIPTPDELEVGP